MTDCETSRAIEHLRESFEKEFKRIDQIFLEREKQVALSMNAVNIATNKAEAEALRARDQQNEWRSTVTDLIGRFATSESMQALKEQVDRIDNKSSQMAGGIIMAGLMAPLVSSLLVGFIVYYLTKS